MRFEGLADVAAANPFRLPRLHPGIGFGGIVRVAGRVSRFLRRHERRQRFDSNHLLCEVPRGRESSMLSYSGRGSAVRAPEALGRRWAATAAWPVASEHYEDGPVRQ